MEKKTEQSAAMSKSDIIKFIDALPEDEPAQNTIMGVIAGIKLARSFDKGGTAGDPDRDAEKS